MVQKLKSIVFKSNAINHKDLGALCFELVGSEEELVLIDEMVRKHTQWSSVENGSRKVFANSLVVNDPHGALLELKRITDGRVDLSCGLIWLGRCF